MGMVAGKGGKRADINITPLVDVVLVLLIIFMVLSPTASFYVPNALPKKSDRDVSVVVRQEQAIVQLLQDGSHLFQGSPIQLLEFPDAVKKFLAQRQDKTVFFSVQDGVRYGEVARWMALARTSGASTVSLQVTWIKEHEG